MNLSEILDPMAVKFLSSASSKKRLFHSLGDIASEAYGVSQDDAVTSLLERETLGPTGVGRGVALPHARISTLTRVVGLFVRLEKAVEFDAVDRQPVDLVFALFAPTSAGVDHLKALAAVSRTLRDDGIRSKLRSNEDPATLHAILTIEATEAAA